MPFQGIKEVISPPSPFYLENPIKPKYDFDIVGVIL